MFNFLIISITTLLADGIEVSTHLHGNHARVAFSIFFIFWVLEKQLDGSFCLFHATELELCHNFSFAAQLYSIFMLLNDAALSTREWHFRAVSTNYQRQPQTDKTPGFFGLVLCFAGEGRRGVITKGRLLFVRPIKTMANRAICKKEKIHPSPGSE